MNHFFATTYYSPVILTTNFNNFAFTLTDFDQVGLKPRQGGKPEQVELSTLATAHFNHCS